MGIDPRVSVIIPAYNAAQTIGSAIASVLDQDYTGKVELIVVDDGSCDLTGEVVRAFPSVLYVKQQNAGPAKARNRGALEAKGDFLFFTDSDCRPERSWVSKMIQGFKDQGVSVVAGSYGIANPGSILARVIHEEIIFRHKMLMPEYPRSFGSYNFAVRREVFQRVGGFDEAYRRASGEDNDLSYKVLAAGGKIRFLKDALVDHYHQESLGHYLKEQFRHGFWRVRIYADHPKMIVGDDYTYWKDMIEVLWVAVHGLALFFPGWMPLMLLGFLIFEVVFGWVMMRSFQDGVWAGLVMWLRSFARSAGFLSGGVDLIKNKFLIGKKK